MALASGPKDQDALMRITKLSQATVSKMCAYLEERNFIGRHRHPKKKQKFLFAWTAAEAALQLSRIAKELIK
jgi:DNA-binding MarR family transcriptional regulator